MSNEASAVELDHDALAMLLDEVTAMAEAGRPLIPGLASLDDPSMGSLGRAARLVRRHLGQGRSATEAIASLSGNYQAPIRVAMEAMERTQSTEPIRETVRLIRMDNESKRRFRFALVNPVLNVLVAATVLFFVMPWILVTLSKTELIKTAFSPSIMEIMTRFSQNFFIAGFAMAVVVGAVLALAYWSGTTSSRGNNPFQDHSVFCRWLAMQLSVANKPASEPGSQPSDEPVIVARNRSGGQELGRLIEASAEVAGARFASAWNGVVGQIRQGAQTSDALAIPTQTPQPVQECVVDLATGNRQAEAVAADLHSLGALYEQKAKRHRAWWTERLPTAISWILMIAIIVILLRAILMPLLTLITGVTP